MKRLLLPGVPCCWPPAPPARPPPTPPATAAERPHAAAGTAGPDLAAELPRFHWRLQDATDASGKRIDALFARAELPCSWISATGASRSPTPATG